MRARRPTGRIEHELTASDLPLRVIYAERNCSSQSSAQCDSNDHMVWVGGCVAYKIAQDPLFIKGGFDVAPPGPATLPWLEGRPLALLAITSPASLLRMERLAATICCVSRYHNC